jgi:hypothetical protein
MRNLHGRVFRLAIHVDRECVLSSKRLFMVMRRPQSSLRTRFTLQTAHKRVGQHDAPLRLWLKVDHSRTDRVLLISIALETWFRYAEGTWTYSIPRPAREVEQPHSPRKNLQSSHLVFDMFAVLFVRIALVFTSFSASAHALAVAKNYAPTHVPTRPLDRLASMMPHSSLATPAGQLKYVVLGLGTQNYTCASGDELAAPGTTGATGR